MTLKGMYAESGKKIDGVKKIIFKCPNCTGEKEHLAGIDVRKKEGNKPVQGDGIWEYTETGTNRIQVTPSIQMDEDCHINPPINFEIVQTYEELFP